VGGSSRPTDETPREFKALRQPTAARLRGLSLFGLPQPGTDLLTPAAITQGETESLTRLRELSAGASPEFLTALQTLAQQAGGTQNPFATAAGLTGGEAFGLGELARLGFGGDATLGAAGGAVRQQAGGVVNPLAGVVGPSLQELLNVARIQQLSGQPNAILDQAGQAFGQQLTPAVSPFATSADAYVFGLQAVFTL